MEAQDRWVEVISGVIRYCQVRSDVFTPAAPLTGEWPREITGRVFAFTCVSLWGRWWVREWAGDG